MGKEKNMRLINMHVPGTKQNIHSGRRKKRVEFNLYLHNVQYIPLMLYRCFPANKHAEDLKIWKTSRSFKL